MAMKNLDKLAQEKAGIVTRINQAMKDGDQEAFQAAFIEYTEFLQEAILAEAKGYIQAVDNQILAGRGVRTLTSEETAFYQRLIEVMKSNNPQQSLADVDLVLPKTVIETVFDDITESHPLLGAIRFEDAQALIEWYYSLLDGRFQAQWGPLCDDIKKQLSSQFARLDLRQTKLSAYMFICKAMLDLGPAWLDRYVRTILREAIANGLEYGIIDGRGVAEGAANPDDRIYEPVGMTRDLTDFDLVTGYARKAPIAVDSFSPEEYGALAGQLAVSNNNLYRVIPELLFVCNPVDYYTKIMPATTYLNPNGTYVNNVFPLPTRVVQSAWLSEGEAILGIGRRYIMAMGAGTEGGRIEYSDEYKFLEDQRTYLIKLYGTGRPMDNRSFLLLDINNLQPLLPKVQLVEPLPEA